VILRAARDDEAHTLLAIQREAAVDAFAHIYPSERYSFPDDAASERVPQLSREPFELESAASAAKSPAG